MNQFYTRRNIVISLAVSFAVVGFFVWYTFRNVQRTSRETRIVNTRLQSLRAMEALTDDMQDIETGNRGYVISGNTTLLTPYFTALHNLKADTFLLKDLYPIFPDRKDALEHILTLVRRKIAFATAAVTLVQQSKRDSAYAQIQTGIGRQLMDSIRQVIFSYENEDRKVLQFSNKQRDVIAGVTAKLFGILAIVFFLTLILLFRRIQRDFKKRDENEKKISYLANIVEVAGDAIMSGDMNLNIVTWNKGAEEMYGYTKEEAIGKKYHHLLKSKLSDADRKEIIEKVKADGFFSQELEYRRKNNEAIIVQASFTLLRNEQNEIAGSSIVHRDITEKKKAEELLVEFNEKLNSQVQEKTIEIKDALERFKIITRATNDVVWDADLKKGIVWWNDNFHEKLGYKISNETSAHFWDDHIHPDDRNRVISHIGHILEETKANTWSNEYRFMKADGSYINIYDRSYILRDENGIASRMIGSMADVTDLFLVRKELNQSEEKYRTLVEQATDAIVLIGQDGKISLVNSSACRISGFSETELMKMTIYDLADKDDLLRQPFHFDELRNGKNVISERVFTNKMGVLTHVEINARMLSDGRILAFVRDITERKKAEEEIAKSDARFQIISKATSDIVWDWNLIDDSLWWNDNYYSTLGYKKEKEFVHINDWYNHIHISDIEKVKQKVRKSFSGSDSMWRAEYLYEKSDGTYLNFLDRGYIMRDKEGKAYRMIGSMADITDLFIVREELKQSEERYRSLIEQASDAIIVYTIDGTIHSFNISTAMLLGYTKEEFLHLNFSDIMIGEMIVDKNKYDALLAGNSIISTRRFRKKDGTVIEMEVTAKLLSDNKIMAFGRDVTARIEAELNQQRQFDELQQLYNLSVLIDSEKNINKIYEYAITSLMNGVKADRCAILLFDDNNIMRFKSFTGLSEAYRSKAEGHSPWKHDAHNPESVFIEDVTVSDKLANLKEIIIEEGIKSIGFIPIVYHGKIIGKFMVYYNQVHAFTNNEIQFAKTVAHNIAFSIERHKSNEALQASENRYHSLVDQAADAIALFDSNGKILEVNNSASQLLGYSYDELMKMQLKDILTSDEISNNPIDYNLLEQGKSTIKQRKMKKRDGSVVTTEVNSKILPDGRFLSMVRNLTDRIEAQEQIEKEKNLSNKIIDSLPGVFYFYDENGKFIRWNKQLEIVTGYSGNEIANLHPTQLFGGDDVPYIQQRIAKVFSEGSGDAEADFLFKDGSSKPFYFKAILVNFENRPCLLGTGIDISDRKKAEKELNDSYKAIRKLTRHLQNVREEDRAHIAREIHDELGQQLTVLKMDVSWLNKKIVTADDIIKTKMKDMLTMLDETVKTVRRISSELRPSLLDDLGLVAAMEWQLLEFKKRSKIKTIFLAPEEEIELSDTIKTGLFRIFQESLTNVVRHSDAKKLEVSLEHKDSNFVLTISDDGKGFDKDKIADKKTLGILGMKERTSMLGGSYEIASTAGKGTIVTVAIPMDGGN